MMPKFPVSFSGRSDPEFEGDSRWNSQDLRVA
jgi:hypothetical protein